jgi:hypothetical protein
VISRRPSGRNVIAQGASKSATTSTWKGSVAAGGCAGAVDWPVTSHVASASRAAVAAERVDIVFIRSLQLHTRHREPFRFVHRCIPDASQPAPEPKPGRANPM